MYTIEASALRNDRFRGAIPRVLNFYCTFSQHDEKIFFSSLSTYLSVHHNNYCIIYSQANFYLLYNNNILRSENLKSRYLQNPIHYTTKCKPTKKW